MAAPRGLSAFRPDQLWQQAREPLFWLDPAMRLSWVNRAWEVLTGYPGASVLGLPCIPISPEDEGTANDLAASFAPPAEAVHGQPAGQLSRAVRGDGQTLWLRVEFWPFNERDGKLIGLLGQAREQANSTSVPDSKTSHLRVQLMRLREELRRAVGFESLLGSGPAHARLLQQIRLAAASAVPSLIVGEPGTGRRLIGRIIHELGPLREDPLILLDCEALPAEAIERELIKLRQSSEASPTTPRVEGDPSPEPLQQPGTASTLLIGDVLALPRDLQLQLEELLPHCRSVRMIATTAGDPEAAVSSERLRPDLYHAMTALVLRTLPLRKRREDVPLLAQHLLERVNRRTGFYCGGFDDSAISALEAYDWPGNVRELERVIAAAHERARNRLGGETPVFTIEVIDIPGSIRGNLGAAYLPPTDARPSKPLDELLTEIERRLIETALSRARQNKSRAAELLGISRPRLYRRIKELNLPDENDPVPESQPQPTAAPAAL
jgi:DNA-binding NtrC family response regulator